MSAVQKQGKRLWTAQQRLEQSHKLRERQIWLKSTGPRTTHGKIASSANARKADYHQRMAERAELKTIRTYLHTQKSYIDLLNLFVKQRDAVPAAYKHHIFSKLNFLQNELIDLKGQLRSGLANLNRMSENIIPFPSPPLQNFT